MGSTDNDVARKYREQGERRALSQARQRLCVASRRLELTRFRGRLTGPSFGAEVSHEVQPEGRLIRTAGAARVQRRVQGGGGPAGGGAPGGGRDLDVRPDQLRAWGRAQRGAPAFGSAVPGETVEQENRRLRRENATLRQEQAFAKKVAVYFAKESR